MGGRVCWLTITAPMEEMYLRKCFRNYVSAIMSELSWADFEKVEMRVGTIIEARDFPEARNPSYRLIIDFGIETGIKKSSAQITTRYSKEELEGKQVIAVVNFPKKQIAGFMSECLVLGGALGKDVILLEPERPIPNGTRIG